MAIYHLSAKVITRGAGHSSVHAAAYRARSNLADERTGLKHDYSRKSGDVLFSGIYAPKGAPDWTRDREQLWNHVEAFEKHRRAELAREYEIALPSELTLEQNRHALQDWVRENFTRRGLIADVNIHAPGKDGDERNIHAHVMVVMRKLDGSEFARTKERFEKFSEKEAAKKAELEKLRVSWERIGNRHLERHGFEPGLDHRSLEAQGIERAPTIHQGKEATALERKGKTSELGTVNREIAAANANVIELAAEREARAPRSWQDEYRERAQQTKDERLNETLRFAAAAQEALQRPERARGAETRAGQQRASQAPEIASAPAAEPAREITRAAGSLAAAVTSILGGVLNFFAGGAPKLTRQQVHDRQQAAGNIETQHAEAVVRHAADIEAERAERISREDSERQAPLAAPGYFRTVTRPADPAERRRQEQERDGGREREIER